MWIWLTAALALPPADLDLVRDEVTRAMRPSGRIAPAVIRYRAHGKALDFVAARHQDADTIACITRTFADFRPDIVIVEGIPAAAGPSPLQLDGVDRETVRDAAREPRWTALLATEAGVPYRGGEPTRRQVLDALLNDGTFDRDDYLAYEIVRILPQWRRQGVQAAGLGERVEERRRELARTLDLPLRRIPTWREVAAWYQVGNDEPLTLDMPVDRVGLGSPVHRWKTKRMSHAAGRVRNRAIAATVHEALTAHDRVLVVYGASHYVSLLPFLDGLMNEPVEVAVRRDRLYPDSP